MSPSRPDTRKAVSTLAATICSTVWSPATLREKSEVRGSTAWIVVRPPAADDGLIATQSPTAGRSRRLRAACRSRPARSASSSPRTPWTRNVAP
jgi:hypothetical protein